MSRFEVELDDLEEFDTSAALIVKTQAQDGSGKEQKATLPSSATLNALTGVISTAELAVLDGVTAGTVTASKALVVDASKDLASLQHLTITGNLVTGATTLSEAELGVLDAVTPGTVAASKAAVVDANRDLGVLRNVTLDGAQLLSAGAAAAAIAMRFGASVTEGLEVRVIDEVVATGAINNDLTEDVPSGAVILSVQSNVETALTGGSTTSNYGIGTSANPDLYSPTVGALTQDAKTDHIPDWAILSGAESIQVNGVTAGGDAGDTALTVGTVRVRIVYLALNSLDDA